MRNRNYFLDASKECYKNWENGIFIIGNEDEVIDHSITKRVVGKAKVYEVSGGHKLSKDSYDKILISEIKKVKDGECYE